MWMPQPWGITRYSIPHKGVYATEPSGYFKGHYTQKAMEHLVNKQVPIRAGTLATAVGTGNFMTRNYRQKPVVVLQKAEHFKLRKETPFVLNSEIKNPRTPRISENKILSTTKAMPYKRISRPKKFTRTGRKRIYRRKRRIPLGIARKKLVRFRVCSVKTLTQASTSIMVKANSLNQPIAGSTSLPTTVDQWAAFYEKYTVLGSKIKVTFSPTTNTGPVNAILHLAKNNTELGLSHYKELPMTKSRYLTTQRDLLTMSMNYSGKKFWHVASLSSDSEQEGAFSTTPGDPTDLAYFHIVAGDLNGGNDFTLEANITIEFICMLNEPINVARSSA